MLSINYITNLKYLTAHVICATELFTNTVKALSCKNNL